MWRNEPAEPKLKAFVQEARWLSDAVWHMGKAICRFAAGEIKVSGTKYGVLRKTVPDTFIRFRCKPVLRVAYRRAKERDDLFVRSTDLVAGFFSIDDCVGMRAIRKCGVRLNNDELTRLWMAEHDFISDEERGRCSVLQLSLDANATFCIGFAKREGVVIHGANYVGTEHLLLEENKGVRNQICHLQLKWFLTPSPFFNEITSRRDAGN